MVLWAVEIEPLSESHCTGCGARIDEVASIPTAALRGARTGWRYALPLDMALVTSRVRARRVAKNAYRCGRRSWAARSACSGTARSFQEFAALRSRLLQAIRDEAANGQTPALMANAAVALGDG
jgi:hypothetical protein